MEQIRFLHHVEAGSFLELDDLHLLFTVDMEPCELTVGDRLPISCMFDINELLLDNKPVGYLFRTQFYCHNEGGYVVAYTRSGAGKATEVETLLKHDNLVIFHYPNRGTLAISPKVNSLIANIFEEQ